MSESDQSEYDRPWWVMLGIIAVLLFISVLLAWAMWMSYSNWDQSLKNTQQIEAYSNRYTVERCNRTDPVDAYECIKQTTQSAQDQQRSESDLYAQRQMAIWTIVVAVCAVISLPLSIAGIFFVWRSLALNRMAVDAANQSNSTTREIGRDQSRAYVTVCGGHFTWGDINLSNPQIILSVENTGESPAVWFSVSAKVFNREGQAQDIDLRNIFMGNVQPKRWNALGPKSILTLPISTEEARAVQIEALAKREVKILNVAGIVTYETIFGEIYESEFWFTRRELPTYRKVQTEQVGTTARFAEFEHKLQRPIGTLRSYRKISEA